MAKRDIKFVSRILDDIPLDIDPVNDMMPGSNKNKTNQKFSKENKLATRENISEEADKRRMQGLGKATMARIANAANPAPHKNGLRRKKRTYQRRQTRIALEAAAVQNRTRSMASLALNRLEEVLGDDSAQQNILLQAIALTLDRAYGKASQVSINANVNPDAKPKELTDTQLAKRIEDSLKRVEGLARGVPEAPKSEERPDDVRLSDRDTGGSSIH